MYSGALLATAARLLWDPSTYTWFRYLCETQYRVTTGYLLAAGLWLAGLVYVAASAAHRPATTCLHLYGVGVVCLAVSEVAYGSWMAASLSAWWRSAPQADLVRHGMDLLHDIKPALLAVERYAHVARPIYAMIEEVEQKAPNNAYVIFVFGLVGMILQIAAFVMSRRLVRRVYTDTGSGAADTECGPRGVKGVRGLGGGERALDLEECSYTCEKNVDDDSDGGRDPPPGWRKKANLRMYTILDKIF
ncbi:unnamed protein product [Danaus chrysippus]|uniref:(African queen) hypothetical protein n=1 Tax=Danaus chrysippus TaxID=151541 RepID=A0A8J2QLY1_9NEOP|nr:unnamed protein product [Danaus chrysippus]